MRATIKRFRAAGLSWPLPEEQTDAALEAKLFGAAGTKEGHRRQVEPDWASIQRELKRKHVTLSLLWDEYIERYPEGYRYSRFCELYRRWERKLSVTMRQAHVGSRRPQLTASDPLQVVMQNLRALQETAIGAGDQNPPRLILFQSGNTIIVEIDCRNRAKPGGHDGGGRGGHGK